MRCATECRTRGYNRGHHAHLRGIQDGIVRGTCLAKPAAFWREFLHHSPGEAEFDLLRRHARTGGPLGSDAFLATAERMTGRTLAPKPGASQPNGPAFNVGNLYSR
ncbi:MAG: hypothetical protein HYZ53_29210 [Planctomycetes bacterium]|nr:hypothetical protein [Planctomycetota bacterium]